jgi:hypothetical protein
MINDKLTTKYDPAVERREHNVFTEEYFSGADVAIYIDGELIQNISSLSFQIQEQLKPLFGYASRTYDDIAVGNRIVVGTLRVPISNPEENSVEEIKEMVIQAEATDPKSNGNPNTKPDWAESAVSKTDKRRFSELVNGMTSGYTDGDFAKMNSSSPYQYNDELKKVQRRLIALGYNVEVNGYYDSKTKKAILQIQHYAGLNETGTIDEATMNAISILEGDITNQGYRIAADTKLRSGPGSNYTPIANLAKDTPITIISTAGEWYVIQIENGTKGYVYKDMLLK